MFTKINVKKINLVFAVPALAGCALVQPASGLMQNTSNPKPSEKKPAVYGLDDKVYKQQEAVYDAVSKIIEALDAQPAKDKPALGVLDFDSDSKELSEEITKSFSDKLGESGRFTMIARDEKTLEKIHKERQLQYSDAADENSIAVKLGNTMGARYLVHGDCLSNSDQSSMKLTVYLTDVERTTKPFTKPYRVSMNTSIKNQLKEEKICPR